jgi:hypothetical protein
MDEARTTAICLTVPIRDTVELLCESAAGDLASETAMPLGLIARELIGNAAEHALAGRSKVSVRVGLPSPAGTSSGSGAAPPAWRRHRLGECTPC